MAMQFFLLTLNERITSCSVSYTHLDVYKRQILLTWTEDPTTTITIDWHTAENQSQQLFFREKGKEKWEVESGKTHPFPFSDRFEMCIRDRISTKRFMINSPLKNLARQKPRLIH